MFFREIPCDYLLHRRGRNDYRANRWVTERFKLGGGVCYASDPSDTLDNPAGEAKVPSNSGQGLVK